MITSTQGRGGSASRGRSASRGGGSASIGSLHPGGLHPGGSASRGSASREGLHLGEWSAPRGGLYPGEVCIQGVGNPPPPLDTTGYRQRAGGTHPTGMHSCSQ